MASDFQFSITGTKELDATFAKLDEKAQLKIFRPALKKSGAIMVTRAKNNLRRALGMRTVTGGKVFFRRRTGDLYRSLGLWLVRSRRAYRFSPQVKIGPVPKKYKGTGKGHQAHLIELGHVASGWYAKQSGAKFVPARPFLRPAMESSRANVMARFQEDVRKRLERLIKRLAKKGQVI